MKKTTHGGKRPGSGRPKLGKDAATERVIFRVTKAEWKKIEDLSKEGESANQTARRLFLELLAPVACLAPKTKDDSIP